jgi:hypothetical protein
MNTKKIGEACLATLAIGSPILEKYMKNNDDRFDIHSEIVVDLPNHRIGINAYNIGKLPQTFYKTEAQLVTLLDI